MLGVAGASVTVYLTLGGFLPNINRSARMIELEAEIKEKWERVMKLDEAIDEKGRLIETSFRQLVLQPNVDNLRNERDFTARLRNETYREVKELEKENDKQTRSLRLTSVAFYIPLGGVFATILAVDYLQALAIGGGWTAFISLTQLNKKDREGKENTEDESRKIDETSKKLDEVISTQTKTITENQNTILTFETKMKELNEENTNLMGVMAKMAKKMKESDIKNL